MGQVYDEFKIVFGDIFTMKNFIRLTMFVCIMAAIIGGCHHFNTAFGIKDDNVVEEAIEEKIKEETGLQIDLTPRTPEYIFGRTPEYLL